MRSHGLITLRVFVNNIRLNGFQIYFRNDKHLSAQENAHTFHQSDPVSSFHFLKFYKLACDTNGVHEGTAMWLFYSSIDKIKSAVLIARFSDDGKKYSQSARSKKRNFTTYAQIDSFLLKNNSTDIVNAATESDITSFS